MPATGRLSLVPLGLAAFVTGCSPTLDWRQVRPEGGAVTLLLPCKPERRTRAVVLADVSATVEVLACSAGGTTWGMTSADLGEPARVGPALAALRAARTTNLEGRETEARAVRLAKLAAEPAPLRLRVEGRKPDGQPIVEHSLLFAHGSRVFQAVVLGGAPSARALETFFDGIEPAR
ncbi:MAG: hypothetical protein H0W48_05405 [Methylibium sp.]|uniref:hypothetical protein n=1 Tax=Methylibium sp. TaxID=2067992 RepID=UPI001797483F|nr:hypothetical protein [Methylibium sp.]MBA2722120.1 hypothetical protein [Methylibium sp.]MBA3588089.1 hypothetical protein [Methylibium sp.]MBA3623882.1 hypothetical protein [Methylibium sp.]